MRVGEIAKRFAASSPNQIRGVIPCQGRGDRIGSVVRFSLLMAFAKIYLAVYFATMASRIRLGAKPWSMFPWAYTNTAAWNTACNVACTSANPMK